MQVINYLLLCWVLFESDEVMFSIRVNCDFSYHSKVSDCFLSLCVLNCEIELWQGVLDRVENPKSKDKSACKEVNEK